MYQTEHQGRGGIVARVVADSISESGSRITTIECEYPRFIHSEIMTHRLFSRNAMSSRAVPIAKMIEQVRNNPAMPIHWGANQTGMQADLELDDEDKSMAMFYWENAAVEAAIQAESLAASGAHKQIVNRLLEPFQMMKTVITATEWDNFFHLRRHKDAQPETKELADCIYTAMDECEPEQLKAGEWHTPYVDHFDTPESDLPIGYMIEANGSIVLLSLEEALRVSASCCAQVSYRMLDNSLDKALMIYDRLVESKPVHSSPFEHQATPMSEDEYYGLVPDVSGVTHKDQYDENWSGNLKGWIQYRHTIPNNTCWEYEA